MALNASDPYPQLRADEYFVACTIKGFALGFLFSPFPFDGNYARRFLLHPNSGLVYTCPSIPETEDVQPEIGILIINTLKRLLWLEGNVCREVSPQEIALFKEDLYTIDYFTFMFGGSLPQANDLYDAYYRCKNGFVPRVEGEGLHPWLTDRLSYSHRLALGERWEAAAGRRKLEQQIGPPPEGTPDLGGSQLSRAATDTSRTFLLHEKSGSRPTSVGSAGALDQASPARPEPAALNGEDYGGFPKTRPLGSMGTSPMARAPPRGDPPSLKNRKSPYQVMVGAWSWFRNSLPCCLGIDVTEVPDKPRTVMGKEFQVLIPENRARSVVTVKPPFEAMNVTGGTMVTEETFEAVNVLSKRTAAEPVTPAPVPGQAF